MPSPATPSGPPSRLTPVWWLLRGLAVLVVRVVGGWRVRVVGLERVSTEGGAVLAFNHHSYFDFVMVGWDIVRKLRRPVRFLAKREIWRSRWFGWVVRIAKAVPVDRDDPTSRSGAFDAAIQRLREGELVAVAPEQTISPSFELLPLRTGAARMALGSGVPLIPAIGWGTQRFAAKGHGVRLARGITVDVVYGEPIVPRPGEDAVALTARLESAMQELLRRLQDEYPDPVDPDDDWWVPARLGGSAPNHDEVLAEHRARFERRHES